MTPPRPEQTLTVQRLFPAPRERVFWAWTEASALQQWFRPLGCKVTVSRLELRVGGEYQFDLIHPDGETSSINGRYIDITHPERLVFSWVSGGTHFEETEVTVEFFEQGAMTEVRLTHTRLTGAEMLDLHLKGWACIDFISEVL
jgi:uncharacterized protein YndB with AHSA1/START domain